jgi:hypothetical protein
MREEPGNPKASQEAQKNRIEQGILRAVRRISYGSVEVIIHDARSVQILPKKSFASIKAPSLKVHNFGVVGLLDFDSVANQASGGREGKIQPIQTYEEKTGQPEVPRIVRRIPL